MKNNSLWQQYTSLIDCPKLNKNISCDILIIGGGITGISTAYHLKNTNKNVVLIDQETIGSGTTSKTTGKLTYLQDTLYKIKNSLYLKSQIEAINLAKEIIEKERIKCNFEKVKSILYANNTNEIKNIKDTLNILEENKIKYEITTTLPVNQKIKYAISVDDTYVFHPLKFVNKLKKICLDNNIKIYEHTQALKITKYKDYYVVNTKTNIIKAKKVILTCHYPFFLLPYLTPFKTYIERSFIATGPTKENKKTSMINTTTPIYSYRYYEDNLITATNSYKLGNHLDYTKLYDEVIKKAKKNIKEITYLWQNHDLMTWDYMPLIGRVEKHNPDFLMATGFNTWGMTNGILAGKILKDLVLEEKNEYEELFNPHRPYNLTGIKNLIISNFHNAKTFIISKTKNHYSYYLSNMKITKIKGQKVAVIMDEDNKAHFVKLTCPHMKCDLTFNNYDKTWDCPCHGSRFDLFGNLIQGPSTKNIKID